MGVVTESRGGCTQNEDARRAGIRRYYRWISRFYGLHEGWFERALREKAVELLCPAEGEAILEVGCGAGFALPAMAARIGPSGSLSGLDLSLEMIRRARAKTEARALRASFFTRADALALPFRDGVFDAVYMSGVLELYDEPARVEILKEVARVLKPESGRAVVAAMSDDGRTSSLLRAYEWVRAVLPGIVPCGSVDGERFASEAGLSVQQSARVRLKGLVPIEILLVTAPRFV